MNVLDDGALLSSKTINGTLNHFWSYALSDGHESCIKVLVEVNRPERFKHILTVLKSQEQNMSEVFAICTYINQTNNERKISFVYISYKCVSRQNW